MERNPYTPPAAAVADVASEQPVERPPSMTLAIRLLWASVVLAIVGLFTAPRQVPGVAGFVVIVITGLLVFGILAWLIVKMAAARNWARITYTVLSGLGYLGLVFTWDMQVAQFKASPLSGVISLVNFAVGVFVLYLLYTKASSVWFRSGVRPVR